MIPKIIHYCWFGKNPKPILAEKCIESWKKNCPDYIIKEWNENNFDVGRVDYVREAYEARKWAFVTDYVRLFAMVTEGGIYLDTDVEILRPLDSFLIHRAFSGFENTNTVPTGIMACEKKFPLFQELLDEYEIRHFKLDNKKYDLTPNVVGITNKCVEHGLKLNNELQEVDGFVLYPKDVFCPKSYVTGVIEKTDRTYTIHHFSGSWRTREDVISGKIKGYFGRYGKAGIYFGKILAAPFTFIAITQKDGLKSALRLCMKKILFLKRN